MMKNCEFAEIALSSFIDGELDRAETPSAIDHLVECARCRAFYRDARALDALVLDVTTEGNVAPSNEVWSRIAGRSALVAQAEKRAVGASWTAWGALAAGLLLVAVGLWATPRLMDERVTPPPTGAPVVVVGHVDNRMSDERFVELTTELLRSDPRYQKRMLKVMQLVTRPVAQPEGSPEGLLDDLREPSRRQDAETRDLTFDAGLSGGQS